MHTKNLILTATLFFFGIASLCSVTKAAGKDEYYYIVDKATGNLEAGLFASATPHNRSGNAFERYGLYDFSYFSLCYSPASNISTISITAKYELKEDSNAIPALPLQMTLSNGTVLKVEAKYTPYIEDTSFLSLLLPLNSWPELSFKIKDLHSLSSPSIENKEALRLLCIYDITNISSVPDLKITKTLTPNASTASAFREMCKAINIRAKDMGSEIPYQFVEKLPSIVPTPNNTTSPKVGSAISAHANTFIEPTTELSIKEMITRPLGLVEMKDSIWDIKLGMLLNEAKRRSNWDVKEREFEGKTTQFNILGNHQYHAPDNERGYNKTYHGEPIANVSVSARYPWGGDASLSGIQYSWDRGIKGKVPQYRKHEKDKTLAQRSWTETEAKTFANMIVNDLLDLDINMHKGHKLKGDIYDMCGFNKEGNTLYNVRVFKSDDAYSAFYSVLLEITDRNDWRFQKELKNDKK